MQTTLTMTRENITRRRLDNQQVSAAGFMRPESLVAWMGCVQAQDFAAAKWAIGSRLKGAADKENPEGLESPVGGSKSGGAAPRTGKAVAWTDAGVQQAFNEGKILRTHILQPTSHFLTPPDTPLIPTLPPP